MVGEAKEKPPHGKAVELGKNSDFKEVCIQQENLETFPELDLLQNQQQCHVQKLSETATLQLCEDEESALAISRGRVQRIRESEVK